MSIYYPIAGKVSRLLGKVHRLLQKAASSARRLSSELLFLPRSDDIYMASYPRSGTTLLQMVLYQLTTDGNMDFTHISEVVPFYERALLTGRNLNRLPSPRVFKTHLRFHELPKGTFRYIYLVRDGKDVLQSYFAFHRTHLRFTGTFEEFFDRFLQGRVGYGSWFSHVEDWRRRVGDPSVLFLTYEDLTTNLEAQLPKIASFCGLSVSPDRFPVIAERCSFSFMKENEAKFDHITEVLWEKGFVEGAFIRQGKTGAWKDLLTTEQVSLFDARAAALLRPGADCSSAARLVGVRGSMRRNYSWQSRF